MKKLMFLAVLLSIFSVPVYGQEKTDNHKASEAKPTDSSQTENKSNMPDMSQMTTYYMGILSRGPKYTPEQTEETRKIFEGHMAHIRKMADAKQLVLAGPITDNGQIRGIFIFKVASLEEAKALAEADPAVKAGRLAVEVHPWLVEKGILP